MKGSAMRPTINITGAIQIIHPMTPPAFFSTFGRRVYQKKLPLLLQSIVVKLHGIFQAFEMMVDPWILWKSLKLMEIRFSHMISSDNSPSGKQPTWKPSAARHCSSRLPGSKEGLPHGWVGIHHLAKLTMEHFHALNILHYLFKWI